MLLLREGVAARPSSDLAVRQPRTLTRRRATPKYCMTSARTVRCARHAALTQRRRNSTVTSLKRSRLSRRSAHTHAALRRALPSSGACVQPQACGRLHAAARGALRRPSALGPPASHWDAVKAAAAASPGHARSGAQRHRRGVAAARSAACARRPWRRWGRPLQSPPHTNACVAQCAPARRRRPSPRARRAGALRCCTRSCWFCWRRRGAAQARALAHFSVRAQSHDRLRPRRPLQQLLQG